MAKAEQGAGQPMKSLSVLLDPEEHKAAKIRAATYDVSLADVIRMALADESLWRRAAKLKGK